MMHIECTTIASCRSLARILAAGTVIAGGALQLGGCNTYSTGIPDAPYDYRMRHPITLKESDHSLELLIGSNRGDLTPTQRAQVLSFALTWKREATGGVIVERPVGSNNEHASADVMREVLSIFAASGVPPQSVAMRTYPAEGPALAPVRISYPRVAAQVGPCGVWPNDIGPGGGREYFENQPYWNFGCSQQRNLAAMVDNPADLVQPRGETPALTARRTMVLEKYRQGVSSATTESSGSQAAKITDLGK